MAAESKIQWTDATWNIARGCTKVDEDCKYCYMYRESLGGTRYEPKQVTRTKTVFNLPLKLKEPSKIFTSSLTDVFHEEIDSYRYEMWNIIRACPHHTFQLLTKRPERIAASLPKDWEDSDLWRHVWLGTSVGSHNSIHRLEQLRMSCYNQIKFASFEPLTSAIEEVPFWLDWVIIGGESGNENGKYLYRECKIEWIEKIIDDCRRAGTAVFVKQLGTHLAKKMNLKSRHGGDIDEWPSHLQIREFPEL